MQHAQPHHPLPPSSSSPSLSPPLDYDDPLQYTPHRWPHTAIPRHVSYPLLFTYFFLGIAQSLPTTAVSFLMIRPPLSFSPALLTTTYNLWFQLGITRPVFSLLSDHYPILRYRRRPYLLLACLLCVVCTLLMASEETAGSTAAFIALGAGVSLWWAVAEAMVDGAVVEMGNEQVQQAISRLGLDDRNREEQRQRRREYGLDTADAPPRTQSASASGSELRQSLLSASPAPSSSSSSTRSSFGRYTSPIDLITQRIKARLQSECMAVRTTATIVASAISIALLRWAQRDYREVVALTAIAFLPAIIAAFFITERKAKVAWYGLAAVHVDGTAAIADTDSEEEVESLPSSSSSSLLQRATEEDAHLSSPAALSSHHESELPGSRPLFLRAKLSQLWSSLRLAFSPLLFIFLYYAVPSADDAYYYFLYSGDFPFEAWQADLFSFVGLIAALLGTLVYGRFLSSLPVARLFLITTLLSSAVSSLRFLLLFRVTFLFFSAPPAVFIPSPPPCPPSSPPSATCCPSSSLTRTRPPCSALRPPPSPCSRLRTDWACWSQAGCPPP